MKGLEEAKELAKADLPEPEQLRHFIYASTDYRTRRTMKISRFVSTIELWNGKLIQRVFGFRSSTTQRRKWDMEVREVCRYLEGFNHCLLRDVWSDMYSGHHVEYDRTYQQDEFWIHEGKPWSFFGYIMYDESKMIEQLNIPYCQYHNENNKSYLSFFHYICLYRKEPKIELLVKSGLSQYLSGLRYLDLKQKSLDKIFKVDQKFVPMLKDMGVSTMLAARKYPWADSIEDLKEIVSLKHEYKFIGRHMSKRTLEFCKKKKHSLWMYNDYLDIAEKMGMDMKNNNVLYPNDIRQTHDKSAKELKVFKDKQVDEKIKAVSESLKKYEFNNECYDIFPATCTEDLIAESEVLGHCVRTYASRVANGETTIFFVRKHDQHDVPLYTLELRGKKVIQFRGNKNSVPELDARQFVQLWMNDIVKNPDGYRM